MRFGALSIEAKRVEASTVRAKAQASSDSKRCFEPENHNRMPMLQARTAYLTSISGELQLKLWAKFCDFALFVAPAALLAYGLYDCSTPKKPKSATGDMPCPQWKA